MDPLFNLGIVFIIYAIVIGGVGYFVVKFFNRIQNPYNIKIAQIVDRIYLAPNKGIIFIKIAKKIYMISIADNNINLLKEFDLAEIENELNNIKNSPTKDK
ncbi:MAG: flagellar biosynthetic protein FliO [bacterium]|nr:flagellar biosynthetic protein FliO [bacterium]